MSLSSDPITQFYNCLVLKDHKLIEDYIYVQSGKIIDPAKMFWEEKRIPDERIDCKGGIVSPGYIDVQINGAFGYDFSNDTDIIEEAVDNISKGLLLQGCTAYCPTTVSSRPEVYRKVVSHLGPREGSVKNGAAVLGAHIEGPFISPQKKGAHELATLRTAKNGLADFEECYGLENLRKYAAYVTMAPEVEGITDAISELIKVTGVKISSGHSNATTAKANEAFKQGANMITHLFNAMHPFHQRDPGIIGLLGAPGQRPFYGIICDGIHVHPHSVMIAYYAHPTGACLVTDAMSAQSLPEGYYKLGEMDVDVHGGHVYIKGTSTIAGSIATLAECVRNFIKFTGASKVEALENATLHPAQMLGIADRKGTLAHGADADILVLDDDLNVQRVFIAGIEATNNNVVFNKKLQ
ncbi:N-acetyl-glucosamine-6-phosphate deacetylase [Coemansia sp. RSA 1813]|nr:N-acetyl-glucosamine-6-phosphate deacetylase [Coemansia sp. RSA 1646]KAJ1767824.1 N-acetyl-glucosamine-6-phosphate deacetylase [Coemansia sp. RSA 1843]KAJ2088565.1 N-acetyl-glucosamine-6-phosphate deacetylase [Coemansia sp. RSA 986]KAJ2213445.1 N-acetyl-glucosamine-6-phosphate deacetylase [Coemansia sp. RSA 487]KAJ2568343.1 N-acetyl-glucosamine-6-phosphate deacetylase [Coemansia sp. RSA 1813]